MFPSHDPQWANRIDSIPSLQDFVVTWRQDSDKVIIVFTDEEDQSYLVPRVSPEVLQDAVDATPRTKLYVFTDRALHWRDFAEGTGGRIFGLTINQETMYNDLMSILDEICQPPAEEQARNSTQIQPSRAIYQTVSLKTGVKLDFNLLMCY